MKNLRRRVAIPATVVAIIAFAMVLIAGTVAVWLTGETRAFGLVALSVAIVAPMLVVYFNWREKLRQRMLDDRQEYRKAA